MSDTKSIDFSQPFDLSGKVALVTGASKGIGQAIARAYGKCGAKVVVSSRSEAAVARVADEILQSGGEAVGIVAHMGHLDQIGTLIERVEQKYGGLDILVNNAATNPVYGPVVNTDTRVFDKIMNVNVKGPFELSKKAYPLMVARGGGSIINISSIGGVSPEQGLGIYSVSKAALMSLSKVMAKEWGVDGIRVNTICPGLIKTKFSQALWNDERTLKRFAEELPLSRIGMPEDIVGLALLLASDAGAYSTGGVFMVDGGYSI